MALSCALANHPDVTSTDNWATSVIGKTDASITGRNGKPYRALMKAKRLLWDRNNRILTKPAQSLVNIPPLQVTKEHTSSIANDNPHTSPLRNPPYIHICLNRDNGYEIKEAQDKGDEGERAGDPSGRVT